jgi:SPP1 gp7 family putative phage head morphogenesis protein
MPNQPIFADVSATDESRLYPSGETFAQLLSPQDSVLMQRGRDFKIYREVLRDDQCKSAWQQRTSAVIKASWEVKPASKSAADAAAAEFIRTNLEAIEWDRITAGMHFGVWYGHAVGECMWELREGKVWLKEVKVRDRSRFAYDVHDRLVLRNTVDGDKWMPDRKFWTFNTGADHDDEPYGLGLAHYCYWPVFFKRNAIKFWLTFQEKFAMPTLKGTMPAGSFNDATLKAKVLAELRKFATDTAMVVPDGTVVELLEAARSGAGNYEALTSAMDAAIAKIILSQTMTTDDGSSRSQAEVHAGVRDKVVKTDADLLCASFSRQVVTWLTEWNFPGATPPTVWRNLEPPEDLDKRAERDSKISKLGYDPDEEYISAVYGEDYSGWMKRAAEKGLIPGEVANPAGAEFAELGNLQLPISISFDLPPEKALEFLQEKGLRTTRSYADMASEEHLTSFTVAKMMDMDMLGDVKKSLEAAMKAGTPFKEWVKTILPTLQAKGWLGDQANPAWRLETIFRTNMQSAYAVGEWQQIKAQEEVAPYLMYDAVDDFRVRPEHAELDGQIHPVGATFWKHYHPPNDYNCRCGVIQLSLEEIEELGLSVSPPAKIEYYQWTNPRTGKVERVAKGAGPGFDFNPGEERYQQLQKIAQQKAAAMDADFSKAAKEGIEVTNRKALQRADFQEDRFVPGAVHRTREEIQVEYVTASPKLPRLLARAMGVFRAHR